MPRKFSKVFVVANENCERLSTIRLANGMRLAVCLHWRHVFSLAHTHTHTTHTFSIISNVYVYANEFSFSIRSPFYLTLSTAGSVALPPPSLSLSLSLSHIHSPTFFSFICLYLSVYIAVCVYFHIPLSIILLFACLFAFSFIPFSAYVSRILFIPPFSPLSFVPRSFWLCVYVCMCVWVCVCWCSFGLHFIYFPSSIRRTEIRRRISSCHRRWYKIHEVLALLDIHT